MSGKSVPEPNYTQAPNASEWVRWWAQGHSDASHLVSREECEECQFWISLYGPMPPREDIAEAVEALRPKPPRITSRRPTTPKKARIGDDLRWDVWERDDFTCQHCGRRRHLTIDHVIPESAGGATEFANLQTLCKSCNSKKGTR